LTSYVSSLFDILKKLEDNNIQICPKTLKKSILEGINPLGSRDRLRLIFDETVMYRGDPVTSTISDQVKKTKKQTNTTLFITMKSNQNQEISILFCGRERTE
jgi:hypothetical protein